MRKVKLWFVTQVLIPESGNTLTYPRMTDAWCEMARKNGYIVTNTEIEINPEEEES